MAYFECTIGGASGDGVALIVQCDANFAGSTITADNGEDVFTEICPSVSPYTVRFEGIPIGTYTISGEAEGQTFTTQFTVLDYETTLNATPEGATVLPTDDIQTWLHCANIWDKNYSTISQVLADTTTLLALVSSNNAVDYMARSTTWASSVCANSSAMTYIGANDYCANTLLSDSTWASAICNSTYFESVLNVKVPTMTSDTTPSGQCFASTVYDSRYPAYKPFSGVLTTGEQWESSNNHVAGEYIGYDFSAPVKIYKLSYAGGLGANSAAFKNFKLQGSSNKTSGYVDIQSFTYTTVTSLQTFLVTNAINSSAYRYMVLRCIDNYGYTGVIANKIQFYGRASA